MKDFRKLDVWHKAHQLAVLIYKVTESFPAAEVYGLTSQLRRAGVSIPTNLAEGCGRSSDADLARDLKLIGEEISGRLGNQIVEIKKMLASLIQTIRLS